MQMHLVTLCEFSSTWLSYIRKPGAKVYRGRDGLGVNTADSVFRGRGIKPHWGRRVMSLSKTYLPPKSTGNAKKAVAPNMTEKCLPGR